MDQFKAAPRIPANYQKLDTMKPDEIEVAKQAGYITTELEVSKSINRLGNGACLDQPPAHMQDWRLRICLIWFCYIYENLKQIRRPMGAIEEILVEFRFPEQIDLPNSRLGTLYAGAFAWDPLNLGELERHLEYLRPHYWKTSFLLSEYRSTTAQ
jgi:hypothetical protein